MKRNVVRLTLGLAAMAVVLVGLESQANAFGHGSCGSHGGCRSHGSCGSHGGLFHRHRGCGARRAARESRAAAKKKKSTAAAKRSPAAVAKAPAIAAAAAAVTIVIAAAAAATAVAAAIPVAAAAVATAKQWRSSRCSGCRRPKRLRKRKRSNAWRQANGSFDPSGWCSPLTTCTANWASGPGRKRAVTGRASLAEARLVFLPRQDAALLAADV